ncbi:MAG: hypothetical protein C4520_06025 [Candidatus Abyssobacteria bacterium SURF_5]|uniref:Sulfatase N-terminal domain-containing protein n=1 Tax=Abyssobacteria bacterium (strain SURF_5) TaxID=2093360 RepID=A0A3A4P6L9_ABYX5|nr:MAG: hypothetical protein C4520_06025 [Candidatus Abyssubacteria bacterium SURF_5]
MKKHLIIFAAVFAVTIAAPILFWRSKKPNIVLICIDTLRADHFTAEHMPLTYQWAKENAAIYNAAYSNSTWTLPSHVSMFSGLLPSEHKVANQGDKVAPTFDLLPETLQKKGYTTAGFVENLWLSAPFGFSRGFHEYIYNAAPQSAFANAEKFLESAKTPYFIFINTMTVHEWWATLRSYPITDEGFVAAVDNPASGSLYAEAVSASDKQVFQFIAAVLKHDPETRIILTSDHGEGLGESEYGYVSKGHHTYPVPSQTRVPLIISGKPRTEGALFDLRSLKSLIIGEPFPAGAIVSEINYKDIHYTATISERQYAIKESDAKPSNADDIPPDIAAQLKTLGYLN